MTQPRVAEDRRPTLLLVTTMFPPHAGGVETYVLNLANVLSGRGKWRVVVVSSAERGHPAGCVDQGDVRIYRLRYQVRLSNSRFGLRWRRHLQRIIREEAPVLINAHAPVPSLADLAASVARDIPLVVTYHMGTMHKGRMPADALIAFYERVLCPRMLRRADWIITSSDFVREGHLRSFGAKCSTVSPGVDIDLFTPAAQREPNAVLFVGSLNRSDPHKGLDSLLQAVARLIPTHPELRLRVVGSGSGRQQYEALAGALGLDGHVSFRGQLSGQELVDAYRAATALALPTRNDSFPLVLLEAMACGVPVVSTTVGGIPAIVDDTVTGFLIQPDDVPALAEFLARVLDDDDLAARLGRAGRDKVASTLSCDLQVDRTEAVFAAVLADRFPSGNACPPGEPDHPRRDWRTLSVLIFRGREKQRQKLG